MTTGLELWGLVLLPAAVVGGIGLLREVDMIGSHLYQLCIGSLSVAIALNYLYQYPPYIDNVGTNVGIGIFVVLAGAMVLVVTAGGRILGRNHGNHSVST